VDCVVDPGDGVVTGAKDGWSAAIAASWSKRKFMRRKTFSAPCRRTGRDNAPAAPNWQRSRRSLRRLVSPFASRYRTAKFFNRHCADGAVRARLSP
jgi:hypothetical protein